jgi:NTE family protein
MAASLRRRPVDGPVRPLDLRGGGPSGRGSALALIRRPRQLLNGLLLTPELVAGRRSLGFLSEALRARHGDQWPDAALWIVAVRRRDGQRVVFGRDGDPPADIASAVAASCAIPTYFAPVDVDGVSYVDGGVHSPTNADLLAPCDLDLVIVSSPMSMRPRELLRPRLDSGVRLLFHRYLSEEVWVLRRRQTRVIRIEPDAGVLATMGLNMMNGQRIDEVADAAHRLAQQCLRGVVMAP